MTTAVWGTGYGAKRHVVNEATRNKDDDDKTPHRRTDLPQAVCSDSVFLDFFQDGTGEFDGEAVMKKPPCVKCLRLSSLKPCEACNGTGQVDL